jgi:ATP-grasp ribosomal peptide maturase
MPSGRYVLVLTHEFDPTADKVVEELNDRRIPVFRMDTSEFPEELSVSARLIGDRWTGYLRTVRRSLDLSEISGIYYRRPTHFKFHPHLSQEEQRWSGVQARMGFGGLLATLDPWLNHPHHIGYAEYKPIQLCAATGCGLKVPRTIVTNELETVRAFVDSVGKVIYKPFGGSGVYDDAGLRQAFCTPIDHENLSDLSVTRTMHLFQEDVAKDYEVRMTVVDGRMFATRIDAYSSAAHTDWRSDYDSLAYEVIETPPEIESQVNLLLDKLHLRFGAIDFIVKPNGEWWFLECNPNGQWAWIEDATGMPIAAALADALEGKTK